MLLKDNFDHNDQVPSHNLSRNLPCDLTHGLKASLSQCFVVGYGHMGSKVAEVLRQLGYTPILIDPKFSNDALSGTFASIAELPSELYLKSVAWFVCTPTETHLSIFRDIMKCCPHARVMIEKPLCTSNNINDFNTSEIIAKARDLWIDNHYEDCINLLKATKYVDIRSRHIVNLVIEFAKNRREDINNGRYVDNDFMLWGYEGFHMLYIASQLLSDKDAAHFIDHDGDYVYVQGQEGHVSWITEKAVLPTGTKITLRTATDGSIFPGNKESPVLIGKQRKRRVTGWFEDGSSISLSFAEDKETEFAPSDQYSFGWQGAITDDLGGSFWTRDNPLRNHIARFLDNDCDNMSNFELGIRLTRRLSLMASQSYRVLPIVA